MRGIIMSTESLPINIDLKKLRKLNKSEIYQALEENLFSLILGFGGLQNLFLMYRQTIKCKDIDDKFCQDEAATLSLYVGAGTAYFTGILQFAQLTKNNTAIKNINFVSNQVLAVMANNTFFLLVVNAILNKCCANKKGEVDDSLFMPFAIVASFLALVSFTPQLRYKMREKYLKWKGHPTPAQAERGVKMKLYDMTTSLLENFSATVMSIAGVESLIDKFTSLSTVTSSIGMGVRYAIGGIWGVFQFGLRWPYSSLKKESEMVQNSRLVDLLVHIIPSLVKVTPLTILLIMSIASEDVEHKNRFIWLSSGIISLGLVNSTIALCKKAKVGDRNNLSLNTQENHNTLLGEGSGSEEGSLDSPSNVSPHPEKKESISINTPSNDISTSTKTLGNVDEKTPLLSSQDSIQIAKAKISWMQNVLSKINTPIVYMKDKGKLLLWPSNKLPVSLLENEKKFTYSFMLNKK
jgi:hypothetical protein